MASVPASDLPSAQKQELLCTYAALILHDEDIDITEDNINKLVTASGSKVESFVPMLFSRALQGKDVGSMLTSAGNASAGPSTGAATGASAGAVVVEKEEAKEASEEEEEEEDMGFSLFD